MALIKKNLCKLVLHKHDEILQCGQKENSGGGQKEKNPENIRKTYHAKWQVKMRTHIL